MAYSSPEKEILLRSTGRLDGASAFVGHSLVKRQVEAILFAAEAPLDEREIRTVLGEQVSQAEIRVVLAQLAEECLDKSYGIVEKAGKYQFRTRPEFASLISKHYEGKPRNLSKAALETIAIVAYRQPVTRSEVHALRGVDSASILASLEERGLIVAAGKRREVGAPFEFRTTEKFLETFGIKSLKELPSLRSLQMNAEEQTRVIDALQDLDRAPANELVAEEMQNAAEAAAEIELSMN